MAVLFGYIYLKSMSTVLSLYVTGSGCNQIISSTKNNRQLYI